MGVADCITFHGVWGRAPAGCGAAPRAEANFGSRGCFKAIFMEQVALA